MTATLHVTATPVAAAVPRRRLSRTGALALVAGAATAAGLHVWL